MSAPDEARYRRVLGHFATGVTVVAATAGAAGSEEPIGLAVNSFTSVSLSPPLVAFCVAQESSTWPRIRESEGFCVNILAEDQEEISRVFATPRARRFAGVGWRPAPSGAPILAGVLAWIDCVIEHEQEAGDHLLVIGAVTDLEVVRPGGPLVFYRGGYGRFAP